MSSSTRFADFKDQVDTALTNGFDREQMAAVFLGGIDPDDAGVQMSTEEFADTVDSLGMEIHSSTTQSSMG